MASQSVEIIQGTPEWLLARSGKVTATGIADMNAKGKNGAESAGRRNYRAQLVAEILSGKPCEDGYVSADMKRAQELEPYARAAYEVKYGVIVEQVGFVQHPTIERAGCSPDGLVGEDGLIEIKCPKVATHIDYLLNPGKVPTEYTSQIIWQLTCTGRVWCDFVSYCDQMPEHLQLFVARMECDDEVRRGMEKDVEKFLAEVDAVIAKLGGRQ